MKKVFIKHFRLVATIFFVILLAVISEMVGLRQQFTIENFRIVFEKNFLLASLIYILLFSFGNIMQIPGWIFLAGCVLTIGMVPGYFLTLLAAIISTIIGFFLIRFLGRDSLQKIEWKWVQRLMATMHKHPVQTNILLRMALQTAPWLNYTLAMSGLRFRHYIVGAILGLPLPIFIYTFFIDIISEKIL